MRSPRNRSSESMSKPGSISENIVLVNEKSPVPLKVYDLNSPASLSLRRSPRLVPGSDEFESVNATQKSSTVDLNALRKSPRFVLSPESVKSSNANSRATKVHALVDPNSLRRSPRLGPTREELKYSDSSREVSETRALLDPNSLRRSPRLGPIREERNPSESTKRANKPLALMDPSSLRRSSRLGSCSENSKPSDSTPLQSKNLGLVDLNSLRRSPRLVSDQLKSNVGKNQASSSKFERVRKDSGNSGSKRPSQRDTRMSPRFSAADNGGEKKSGNAKSGRSNGQKLTSMLDQGTPINANRLNEKRLRTCRTMKSNTERKSSSFKVVAKTISRTKTQSRKRSFTEMESPKSSNPRTTRARKGNSETKPMPVKNESHLSAEAHTDSGANLEQTEVDNIAEVIKEVITEISDEVDMRPSTFSSALPAEGNIEGNPFDELSDLLDGCPSTSISSSINLEQMSTDGQEESNLIDLNLPPPPEEQLLKKFESSKFSMNKRMNNTNSAFFVGDAIPVDEARERWGWRYETKDSQSQGSKSQNLKQNDDEDDEVILHVECHYAQANIRKCIYSLGDCAYIQGVGKKKHVGRIIEFFKTTNGEKYFRVQWFYFVEDTVIQQQGTFHDKRRLFYSTIMNDNSLDCIISKVHITKITPRAGLKINSIVPSDFYYDMEYCVDYSTFRSLSTTDTTAKSSCSELTSKSNALSTTAIGTHHTELELLDLYSGCGGMSTGLIYGAKVSGVNLVTRWAIDYAKSACESLKQNHPETHVRNEAAEDFLELLTEWEKLCKRYRSSNIRNTHTEISNASEEVKSDDEDSNEVFEVSRLLDICYGDPSNTGEHGLKFKVRWKGYDSSEDTWEPVDGLSNCEEKIAEFVRNGRKMKILPLPAEVDVICGGPPCQGISGYNRFRNVESPLEDERNRQIIIFMDIVNFLKPKYVLMENVVDILRFDKGSLGRYALSRLVHLKYQARLGIIAAGCYGLPQYRLRVFLWGALPHENLPQFPLPTHDVVVRYWPPPEFERNTVAYVEDQPRDLEDALVLQDAISDLPEVKNDETREKISYEKPPETEFQKYIRSKKSEMTGCAVNGDGEPECSLNDHRPWPLSEDDYIRVCKIPKRKGANFRDLPGVLVGRDNVVRRDPSEEIIIVPSGKPLVPEYCLTFNQGKSKRPFARLWWDETVATVLTNPSCHSQAALHPEQDRILTVREYARLQGFPDSYKFFGTVKERYCQIGNAVPVNVSRALGYSLGMAVRKLSSKEPLLTLPCKFSLSNLSQLAAINASQDLTSSIEALGLAFIPNSTGNDFSKLVDGKISQRSN